MVSSRLRMNLRAFLYKIGRDIFKNSLIPLHMENAKSGLDIIQNMIRAENSNYLPERFIPTLRGHTANSCLHIGDLLTLVHYFDFAPSRNV